MFAGNINTANTNINTINTNCSNLNTRLTSTRAGYLDYLANSTYGLNAIKTAISKIPTTSGGGYMIGEFVESIAMKKSESVTKTYTYPVFIYVDSYAAIKIGDKYVLYNSGATGTNKHIAGPFASNTAFTFKPNYTGSDTTGIICTLNIFKAVTS